jgi:hypothetical protein
MGEEVTTADGRVRFELKVVGTQPIVSATLVYRGTPLKTFSGNGTPTLDVTFEHSGLGPGEHWYYWEIAQKGRSTHYRGNTAVARGHLAWSSPHWVMNVVGRDM